MTNRPVVIPVHARKGALILASAALAGLTSVQAAPSAAQHALRQNPPSAACSLVVGSPFQLWMRDGQIPFVGATSAAWNGNAVAIVGSAAYIFPQGATGSTSPVSLTPVLGFVVSPNGAARTIQAPLPGKRVFYPKTVAASPGTWDAVFVESSKTPFDLRPSDTLRLWHGRFDERRWVETTLIATVTNATFAQEMTSDLIRTATGDLLFAFPLGDRGTTGAVLVRRMRGGWRVDTLRTDYEVMYVRLAPTPDPGTWAAMLRMTFVDQVAREPVMGAMFVARVDSVWHRPALAVRSVAGSLDEPTWHATRGRHTALWYEGPPRGDPSPPALRWARPDTAAPRPSTAHSILIRDVEEFRSVLLDDSTVVVLAPERMERSRVRMLWIRGNAASEPRVHSIPTFIDLTLVRRSAQEFWIVSSRVSATEADAPAVNLVRCVRVRC